MAQFDKWHDLPGILGVPLIKVSPFLNRKYVSPEVFLGAEVGRHSKLGKISWYGVNGGPDTTNEIHAFTSSALYAHVRLVVCLF